MQTMWYTEFFIALFFQFHPTAAVKPFRFSHHFDIKKFHRLLMQYCLKMNDIEKSRIFIKKTVINNYSHLSLWFPFEFPCWWCLKWKKKCCRGIFILKTYNANKTSTKSYELIFIFPNLLKRKGRGMILQKKF